MIKIEKMKNEKEDEITKESKRDEMYEKEIKYNAKLQQALGNLAATSLKYYSTMNNTIYKDMEKPLSSILAHEKVVASIIKQLYSVESIASLNQKLVAPDYMIKVTENLFPKDSVATLVDMFSMSDKFKSIVNYPVQHLADTYKEATKNLARDSYNIMLKSCFDEIAKSQIDFSKLCNISNIFSGAYNISENIETIDDNVTAEVVANVKEIVKVAEENDGKNLEKALNEKYSKMKESHPIIIGFITIFFEALVGLLLSLLFQPASNQYYINNYITIEQKSNENINEDFFNNARYVCAEELNVRSAPGNANDIVAKLEFGMVVKVIDKVNYWTKILYINKEENVEIEGWVYSRYLEKFE